MDLNKLNRNKRINAALHIINKKGSINKHSLFKILYFAEQKHLAEFGQPITDQTFIAMKYGPVPSELFDTVKIGCYEFKVNDRIITSSSETNLDYLSESMIQCLDRSYEENNGLGFSELTNKSHGLAWDATGLNCSMSNVKIAEEGGADSEMLQYIKENDALKKLYQE